MYKFSLKYLIPVQDQMTQPEQIDLILNVFLEQKALKLSIFQRL